MKYRVTETQTLTSQQRGYLAEATSLKTAKHIATRRQLFRSTTLRVSTANGTLLAYRDEYGWHDADERKPR